MDLNLKQIDGHWTLTLTEVLPDGLDEMWAAVSVPEQLSHWLPFTVMSLEPHVNGLIVVRNPDGSTGSGVITHWKERSTVGWRAFADGKGPGENDSVLQLIVNGHERGTELISVQRVVNPHVAAMVAVGWTACLGALHMMFTNQSYTPAPPDVRQYEDYVRDLGLDVATLEPIPGGTRIKFERQTLMQPVDKFWSVMTAGLELREGDFAPPTFTGSGESGRISIVSPPGELEYLTSDGGRVKWRFHEHFGSTRVNLQIAVPRSVNAEALAAVWQEHLGAVISRVIGTD